MMTTNVTFMRVTAKVTFFCGRFQLLLLLLEYLNIRYHKIHQHLRKSEKQLFNTLSCVGFMTVPKETLSKKVRIHFYVHLGQVGEETKFYESITLFEDQERYNYRIIIRRNKFSRVQVK